MVFRDPCLEQGTHLTCLCLEQGIYCLDFRASPLEYGCMSPCASKHYSTLSEHDVMFKALYWYLRSSLEQGPKSKRISLNRVSYFPDYSLKQGQGFTVSAAHPHSMTYRVPGVVWHSQITLCVTNFQTLAILLSTSVQDGQKSSPR